MSKTKCDTGKNEGHFLPNLSWLEVRNDEKRKRYFLNRMTERSATREKGLWLSLTAETISPLRNRNLQKKMTLAFQKKCAFTSNT